MPLTPVKDTIYFLLVDSLPPGGGVRDPAGLGVALATMEPLAEGERGTADAL